MAFFAAPNTSFVKNRETSISRPPSKMGQGRQPLGGLEMAKMHGGLLLCSKKFIEKVKAAKTAKFFRSHQRTSFWTFFEIMQLRNNPCIQA